jgi:[ribosomal protein S5]-alanine N-acetyltransferase
MSDEGERVIDTPRLILRPTRVDDVDALLCIFADPRVMACFGVAPFDRPQMEQWVQRNLDHQTSYGYGLYSVILKTEKVLIGDCGLEQMDVDGEEAAELGYDFRSDYWHQGYATEAAVAVRDYAFGALHLSRLISLIRVGNAASVRVAERVGLTRAGEFTRYGARYWKYAILGSADGGG